MTSLTPHSVRSAVLTVAEVIEETADARSIVFDVPATVRRSSPPTGRGSS